MANTAVRPGYVSVAEALNFECLAKSFPSSDTSKILKQIGKSADDEGRKKDGIRVWVMRYRVKGFGGPYRIVTRVLSPAEVTAEESASLYPERWEIEIALGETEDTTDWMRCDFAKSKGEASETGILRISFGLLRRKWHNT